MTKSKLNNSSNTTELSDSTLETIVGGQGYSFSYGQNNSNWNSSTGYSSNNGSSNMNNGYGWGQVNQLQNNLRSFFGW